VARGGFGAEAPPLAAQAHVIIEARMKLEDSFDLSGLHYTNGFVSQT